MIQQFEVNSNNFIDKKRITTDGNQPDLPVQEKSRCIDAQVHCEMSEWPHKWEEGSLSGC